MQFSIFSGCLGNNDANDDKGAFLSFVQNIKTVGDH